MRAILVKPRHLQPIWSGHPWVYAQAVLRVQGGALPGDEIDVLDAQGKFVGRGFYSPGSAIPVRIATRDPDQRLNTKWLRTRLQQAGQTRRAMGFPSGRTTGFRLINGEGDGLPGLTVDKFDDVAVVQLATIGWHRRRDMLFAALEQEFGFRAIIDRTPTTYTSSEGFEPQTGIVRGELPNRRLNFRERGIAYEVPLSLHQKTGYYFDQRPLRGRIEQLAKGKRVLDTYCYVGSISLAAARGGAREVLAVDDSTPAIEIGAEIATTNGLAETITFVRGKATQYLRGTKDKFDIVVLDPPSMAPSRKAIDKALKGFRKIAAAGCRTVTPGGLIVLSACSAAISLDALTRSLALGAVDVGAEATVLERWFQGLDHPVPAAFQEGLYLKTVIARITPRS